MKIDLTPAIEAERAMADMFRDMTALLEPRPIVSWSARDLDREIAAMNTDGLEALLAAERLEMLP